ncbi:hypothetical protein HPB48_002514 [Haemaphysalis longicornis]|uniref:TRAF1-6 MATH domain-containing protein n=1 Tax=Haemaphysalis longicornis TaxID=44386 RepID=A0A9J6G608_HAELO|nr:hypothetical protein HPB48_002514 [Haemaphysalis longicornis]
MECTCERTEFRSELELVRRLRDDMRQKLEARALTAMNTTGDQDERIAAVLHEELRKLVQKLCDVMATIKARPPRRINCVERLRVTESITESWYLDQDSVLRAGNARSREFWLYGYAGRMVAAVFSSHNDIWFSLHLEICPGAVDDMLDWPYSMPYTLSVVPPHDPQRSIKRHIDLRTYHVDLMLPHFGKPDGKPNLPYGSTVASLAYMKQLFGSDPFHLTLAMEF